LRSIPALPIVLVVFAKLALRACLFYMGLGLLTGIFATPAYRKFLYRITLLVYLIMLYAFSTDAPDYPTIITNPMDFSTIRTKIADNAYNHIDDLKKDIDLICENAMAYNQSNTVYYMAAQKLAALAKYYFSEQYQTYLRHSLPFGKDVPFEMMNLTAKPKENTEKTPSKKANPMRAAIVDNMTPAQILKSVNKHTKVGIYCNDVSDGKS
jgi:hypothetical protein